jgi:hypothetical protein
MEAWLGGFFLLLFWFFCLFVVAVVVDAVENFMTLVASMTAG